ncbi:rhomboid family intramembrane serine protease GlpG [Vibrio marisflavi]|uniref:Rhomboid protease GlpG n=1 Tax=Vibrio marisflavi CECT 7928 TaxID=634439 RepID=A0ABM9A9K9_9VIBR|nr:rhomboid family intramembrane serine protease GlpG [Vibrio marisflavi]CAH0542677.1 Rhomboid protease GlpG [Vibrio marisflavi CECT 7928]
MVRLIVLRDPRMAQAFIDYMASRDIEIQMMPEGDGQFALWLSDSQHQIEVESELKHFISNPNDGKYQAASWDMAESRKNVLSYSSPSLIALIKAKAGPFTLLTMLICIVIFVMSQLGMGTTIFNALHFPDSTSQQCQLWRWFTHALLHFSILHITFNLLWWWYLGGDIEKKLGSKKMIQLFLISAAFSGLGQFWIEGANFGGLSGVVYACLGYLWIMSYKAPHLGLHIQKSLVVFMLIWLVLGFMQPFMAIANTAHLVGLVSGIAIAFIDISKKKYQQS